MAPSPQDTASQHLMWIFLLSAIMRPCTAAAVPGAKIITMSETALFAGGVGGPGVTSSHKEDPKNSSEWPHDRVANKPVTDIASRTITIAATTTTTEDDSVAVESFPTRNTTVRADGDPPVQGNYLPEATVPPQRDTTTLAVMLTPSDTIFSRNNVMHIPTDTASTLENVSNALITPKDAATRPQKAVTAFKTLATPETPENITIPPEAALNTPRNSATTLKKDEATPEDSANPHKNDSYSLKKLTHLTPPNPCEITKISVDASNTSDWCFILSFSVADKHACSESSPTWKFDLIDVATGLNKLLIYTMHTTSKVHYRMNEGEFKVKSGWQFSEAFQLRYTDYVPVSAISSLNDQVMITLNPLVHLDKVSYRVFAYPCNSKSDKVEATKDSERKFFIKKEHCVPACSFEIQVRCPACTKEVPNLMADIIGSKNETCFLFSMPDNDTKEVSASILVSPASIMYAISVCVFAVFFLFSLVVSALRWRKELGALVGTLASGIRGLQGKAEVLLVYRKCVLDKTAVEILSRTLENDYECKVSDLYDLRDFAKLVDCHGWIERKIKTSSARILFITKPTQSSGTKDALKDYLLGSSLDFVKTDLCQDDQWFLFAVRCVRDAGLKFNYKRIFVSVFNEDENGHKEMKNVFETKDTLDVKSNLVVKIDSNDKGMLKPGVCNPSRAKDALWFLVPEVRYNLNEHIALLGRALRG